MFEAQITLFYCMAYSYSLMRKQSKKKFFKALELRHECLRKKGQVYVMIMAGNETYVKSAVRIEYRLKVSVSEDTGEPGICPQNGTLHAEGQVTRHA